MKTVRLLGAALLLLLAACRASASFAAPQTMVAAAHPLAVEAGLEVLRRGGSAVDAAIERAGVEEFSDRLLTTLSGGEMQRVQVAVALAQDAPVLRMKPLAEASRAVAVSLIWMLRVTSLSAWMAT